MDNYNGMSDFWAEKIFVVTEDYEITGYIFMPKTIKRERILSDILNGTKRFMAVKEVTVNFRKLSEKKEEYHDFIQINLDSIIFLRLSNDEKKV